MKRKFELMVNREDVNSVLGFAEGLVLNSECPSLSLAALLLECAELAILASKNEWLFRDDIELTFEGLRTKAQCVAIELYREGGFDYGPSQNFN